MDTLKQLLNRVKAFLSSNTLAAKAFHTFWQAFLAVFLVGLTPVYNLVTGGHLKEAGVALVALVGAAVAAGLSALKTYAINRAEGRE